MTGQKIYEQTKGQKQSKRAFGLIIWPILIAFLLLQSACAGQGPETVLDLDVEQRPESIERLWPPPPEVPRYRYVGELVGQQNIVLAERKGSKGGKGVGVWLGTFWRWLTGLGEAHAGNIVLQRPQTGVTDADGRIYVTDVSRQAVFVFDAVAGVLRIWEYADEQRRFQSPIGIASDHLGRLMVTDAKLGEVFRFKPDGTFVNSFGLNILKRPTGIAFDPLQQHIYVADTEADDIKVFDIDGRLLDTVGYSGEIEGRLNRPVYLAFAGEQLYVTDSLNARIQIFDRDGNPVSVIGRRGLYIGNFTRPKGVAVDNEGHIYVIEGFYDHMLVFEKSGRLLMSIGGTGNKPGRFYLPAGVWTDRNNRIYVADMFNGRVSIFQFLGEEQ